MVLAFHGTPLYRHSTVLYVSVQFLGETKSSLTIMVVAVWRGGVGNHKRSVMMAGLGALIIFGLYMLRGEHALAWKTTVGFLTGAICSGLAGFIGMFVSIRANILTL